MKEEGRSAASDVSGIHLSHGKQSYEQIITQPIEQQGIDLMVKVSDCQIINNHHHVHG